ncbi:MAG: tyrosine-type recombinase/integrase [Candidatus Bathyarchaeia archaeon]
MSVWDKVRRNSSLLTIACSTATQRESNRWKVCLKPLKCPECDSTRIVKDGLRWLQNGLSIQRFLCKNCGFRFSLNSSKNAENLRNNSNKIMVDAHEEKNLLMEAEPKIEKRDAGATERTQQVKGKIIEFAWWMKKEGYAENTITRRVKLLSVLAKRGANLFEPESVKEAIARQDRWSVKTKELAVEAYNCFLRMVGGSWVPPIYKPVRKLPFIPTEQEIDQLIAGCNRKTATFLQLLKETGARCGEAWKLEWIDIDFQNKLVKITPEKGGEPRAIKISDKLISMLNTLPKNQPKIFQGSLRHFARSFRRQRTKIALKLQNDRINRITFHTFRHWKATMEYYKTKDILHVMKLLGHKNINNTLLYTQLVNFESNEYHVAVAKTSEEIKKLLEAGFEYVCMKDDLMYFRKRK